MHYYQKNHSKERNVSLKQIQHVNLSMFLVVKALSLKPTVPSKTTSEKKDCNSTFLCSAAFVENSFYVDLQCLQKKNHFKQNAL